MFDKLYIQGVGSDVRNDQFIPIAEEDDAKKGGDYPKAMPLLALKNTVFFPGIVAPITIGRDKSVEAIRHAEKTNGYIAVFSQKSIDTDDPSMDDLYHTGTIAKIIRVIKTPDDSIHAILQGKKRCALNEIITEEPYLNAEITPLEYDMTKTKTKGFKALIESIKDAGRETIEHSPNIPDEATSWLQNITNSSFLLNFIAFNMNGPVEVKQEMLNESNIEAKARLIRRQMGNELELLKLKNKIEDKVKSGINKQQRDYFLNQQLQTIQEELGQNPHSSDIQEMIKRAESKKWPANAKAAFEKEINKLKRLNPQVADFSLTLNYLETLLDLPWDEVGEDNFDLAHVQQVLDDDHQGLDKVKDRIIEHLAVLKLKGNMKAPILCLNGPPGVGKTSLGYSIAKALGRPAARISLGGLHDESEIRGHRRTYIGAMPGRIIQNMKKVKVSNPVFILDEIDKVGKDFRGDPSSALLEVLDPEQNSTFHDNFLEVDYDLSRVLFIATANTLNTIQPALRDRMEIINVDGYSLEEKQVIAHKHLIPKQLEEHGLKKGQVSLPKKVLNKIISDYTRESGVRNLNRRIAAIMRRAARNITMSKVSKVKFAEADLKDIYGPGFPPTNLSKKQLPAGVVVGLAWTQVGGDILFIEASLSPGKGKLTLTGSLGDVMKESAMTALSYLKSHAKELGIDPEMIENNDLHIHVPAGAIPKDGPSAGIAMLSTMASAYTNQPIKKALAMTGEITLRGKVLPVGGIKEKLLAAARSGVKTIILSSENRPHVEEIDQEQLSGMTIHFVDDMKEVLQLAL